MQQEVQYEPPVFAGKEYRGLNPRSGCPDTHGQKPSKVYFYLMSLDEDGAIACDISELDLAGREIEQVLAQPVIDKEATLLPRNTLDDSEWRGPAYLVFVMKNKAWDVFRSEDGKANAIHFATDGNRPDPHENKTFFDAGTKTFTDGDDKYDALVVTNYHLNPDGLSARTNPPSKTQAKEDPYKFDLYYRVKLGGNSGKDVIVVLDPGGRNLGP